MAIEGDRPEILLFPSVFLNYRTDIYIEENE